MAKLVLSISLCVLLLVLGSSLALRDQPQQNECQLEKLQSLEPDHRLNSEAGQIETWNPNNQHFRCVGVALSRCTLERHALRLPSYSNAPQLFYIQKGNGLFGMVFPGCAETFEEPQQSQSGRSQSQDRHQKIRRFRQGDIIAVPAGVAFWIYNSEENPVVAVSILDTSSHQNQLDQLPRRFYLAGNQAQEFLHYQQQQQQQQQQSHRQGEQQQSRREGRQEEQGSRGQQEEEQQQEEGSNIFNGFDEELLAQAFNVDQETARRIQGQKDKRVGGIVRVKGGLSLLSPPSRQPQQQQEEEEEEDEEEEEQQQRQQRKGRRGGRRSESESENGLEETVCTMRLRQNIGKSTNPDIYNPQAGSLRTVNSLDLPVLRWLRLSAEYGSLHKNAIFVPHYNLNANSIIYALRGRARVQVVDCSGNSVYNQELEAGQVLTVPQNYAIAARAQTDKFEYVTFKTNDNAMIATLAGRTSVMKALPEEVVAQAYQLRRDQARQVKNNNPYSFLVAPRDSSQMRAVA